MGIFLIKPQAFRSGERFRQCDDQRADFTQSVFFLNLYDVKFDAGTLWSKPPRGIYVHPLPFKEGMHMEGPRRAHRLVELIGNWMAQTGPCRDLVC